ncbi:MAG: AAA-like domain-containing protein [Candidatus Poribacteria bacterium]|nr:AAA-like domain-containing protein [Candidatus Poribacteria bacterium]
MRTFGTRGSVQPDRHYVVPRTEEVKDFINRVKDGRYIVLFAPRQTGKTTFFRLALATLAAADPTYFPIQLSFDIYKNFSVPDFYDLLYKRIRKHIENVFQKRGHVLSEALTQLLDNTEFSHHGSMLEFFEDFASFLAVEYGEQKIVFIIDEFDGIPPAAVSDFLHTLRHIYHFEDERCLYSVGIVGIKNIAQLNYDRSISPFNIQDEFHLPNFTVEQVRDLFRQYTDEVGQPFAAEVIESIHRQTAGQPFLVNRFGQILTTELGVPKTEMIWMVHFAQALTQLLAEDNANLSHLTTNIRKNRQFETLLMKIISYDKGVPFLLRDDIISELATYGVIRKGADGMCEIINPIYQQCIMQVFQPLLNGLEDDYFPENISPGFSEYLTSDGQIEMGLLVENFKDFITRAGYKILQVPETPKEFVGQYLLSAYLDQFVRTVGGTMFLEVPTGRGRLDLLILHNQQKYIVETKIWEGARRYAAGKQQLAAYLKSEDATEGYYIVFDHRQNPEPIVETETVSGLTLRSYVIPVLQEVPSTLHT